MTCSICLNDMVENTALATMQCGHKFHTNCLLRAFRTSDTCPLCRDRPLDVSKRCSIHEMYHLALENMRLRNEYDTMCEAAEMNDPQFMTMKQNMIRSGEKLRAHDIHTKCEMMKCVHNASRERRMLRREYLIHGRTYDAYAERVVGTRP